MQSTSHTRYGHLQAPLRVAASTSLQRLKQKGCGAGTYCLPTSWLLDNGEEAGLSSNLKGLSSNLAPLSSNSGALPSIPDSLSGNPHWQTLPPELQALVSSLGQRSTPDKLREAIIRLCRHHPWQAAELGSLFSRSPVYLGTQYLRPLVNAGVLAYTLPEQPNHPHQAYRAVEGAERAE